MFANDVMHDLDAVCAVIHTSGTTSAPRPIELTYGNFLWSAIGSGVALGVEPNERWCAHCRFRTSAACRSLIRSAIYSTTAVIHERFEPSAVLERHNSKNHHARLARLDTSRACSTPA